MKHIHFVIYRLKSIVIIHLLLFIYFLFIKIFFIIFIYLEIEFIKRLDDVKIKRKTITFTKDEYYRTVFINKMINSGIMKMFIFYNFYIYIFFFISQVLCICTDNYWSFSMKNIFFFYCNDFVFLLFNNLMRYWYCI
jgi:hypothetical protein